MFTQMSEDRSKNLKSIFERKNLNQKKLKINLNKAQIKDLTPWNNKQKTKSWKDKNYTDISF